MPVRKVSNRSKKNTIGHFPSLKMKRMIAFESLLERDGIYTFDFDQDVLAYEEQPLSIEYEHEGKKRHYTPDFLLKKLNQSVIVECKPAVFVDSVENRRKFDVARKWCDEHGYQFQVLIETELRAGFRLENIKLLTRFARQSVGPEVRARIYDRLYSPGDGLTVFALANHVSPINVTNSMPAILCMAYHHEIVLPLNEAKITGDTPVLSVCK
jgi:TnsA-like endonuclease N terminal